jgi:hypothetical protein
LTPGNLPYTLIPWLLLDLRRLLVMASYGHGGRPVKKQRFIPEQLTHKLTHKLQAKRLGTVAVW